MELTRRSFIKPRSKLFKVVAYSALSISLLLEGLSYLGTHTPSTHFNNYTLQRRQAEFSQRTKEKDSKFKIAGSCIAVRFGNFDEFTNVGMGDSNYKETYQLVRENCDKQDYILHFISLKTFYLRDNKNRLKSPLERNLDMGISSLRTFIRGGKGNVETKSNPYSPAFFMFNPWTKEEIKRCEGKAELPQPLIDVSILEEQAKQYPNTVFVISPSPDFKHSNRGVGKVTQVYDKLREDMIERYNVLDLSRILPNEDFMDFIHYKHSSNKTIQDRLIRAKNDYKVLKAGLK